MRWITKVALHQISHTLVWFATGRSPFIAYQWGSRKSITLSFIHYKKRKENKEQNRNTHIITHAYKVHTQGENTLYQASYSHNADKTMWVGERELCLGFKVRMCVEAKVTSIVSLFYLYLFLKYAPKCTVITHAHLRFLAHTSSRTCAL